MNLNLPQARIKFSDYEKFILPWLIKKEVSSLILYKVGEYDLTIRTFMDGFLLMTDIKKSELFEMYRNKETEVGLEAPPEISESEILNKFNQDFMDSRGIPELD
jgi:hypothetical protein